MSMMTESTPEAATQTNCDLMSTCWLDGFNKSQASSELRVSLVVWFFIFLVVVAGVLLMLFLVTFSFPGTNSSSSSGVAAPNPMQESHLGETGIIQEENIQPKYSKNVPSSIVPGSFMTENISSKTPEFIPTNPFESLQGVKLFDDESSLHNPDLKSDPAHKAAHMETVDLDEFPGLDSEGEEETTIDDESQD